MTDLSTRFAVRQDAHDELARQIAEWQANPKNKIEQIPRGAMAEAGWTPGQRLQAGLTIQTKANAERRKAEEAERKAAKKAKPVISAPPSKPRGTGRRLGGPGTKTGEVLAMLKDGALTVLEIMVIKGWDRTTTYSRLVALERAGAVRRVEALRRPGQRPALGYELVPDAVAR